MEVNRFTMVKKVLDKYEEMGVTSVGLGKRGGTPHRRTRRDHEYRKPNNTISLASSR